MIASEKWLYKIENTACGFILALFFLLPCTILNFTLVRGFPCLQTGVRNRAGNVKKRKQSHICYPRPIPMFFQDCSLSSQHYSCFYTQVLSSSPCFGKPCLTICISLHADESYFYSPKICHFISYA